MKPEEHGGQISVVGSLVVRELGKFLTGHFDSPVAGFLIIKMK